MSVGTSGPAVMPSIKNEVRNLNPANSSVVTNVNGFSPADLHSDTAENCHNENRNKYTAISQYFQLSYNELISLLCCNSWPDTKKTSSVTIETDITGTSTPIFVGGDLELLDQWPVISLISALSW